MSGLQRKPGRHGFTLLELLIVISIIAILTSLSVLVMNGLAEQAERDATKVTIRKLNGLVQQRLESFDRAFRRSLKDKYIADTVVLLRNNVDARFDHFLANPDDAPASLVILAKKAGVRFEFPQRFVDRIGSGESDAGAVAPGMPLSVFQQIAFPVAQTQLIEGGNPSPTTTDINNQVTANWGNHSPETESAELLYFTLVHSANFGASTTDADQFTDREIADTDGDGLPEFIDAWGQPLRFYRWPTRLVDPDAPDPFQPNIATVDNTETRVVTEAERTVAGLLLKGLPPAPIPVANATQRDMLLIDPDDPVGLLYTMIEDPKYLSQNIFIRNEINEAGYHTLDTWHTPLIVSAGPDEELGLREPNEFNSGSGIYGNLAQLAGTTTSAPTPSADVIDQLTDNIANRNSRAGGRL